MDSLRDKVGNLFQRLVKNQFLKPTSNLLPFPLSGLREHFGIRAETLVQHAYDEERFLSGAFERTSPQVAARKIRPVAQGEAAAYSRNFPSSSRMISNPVPVPRSMTSACACIRLRARTGR